MSLTGTGVRDVAYVLSFAPKKSLNWMIRTRWLRLVPKTAYAANSVN